VNSDHRLARALGYCDENGLKNVTTQVRDLTLKVLDDDHRLGPFVYHAYCHRRTVEILKWCIDNHLTGAKLYDWLSFHFGKSTLSPLREILKLIDSDETAKPIIAGRDFISR
jgi:hypothetical protein